MSKIFSNIPELSSEGRRMSIPGLETWLGSAQSRYVLDWERMRIDETVSDVFGFNALQLGMPQIDFLHANRIPLRQRAGESGPVDALCDLNALPFAAHSTDLVVLPHVLEFHHNPHQILREIERILIPEGQLVILGFNPLSLWGIKNRTKPGGEFPWNGNYISPLRLKDWLKLLSFEVDRNTFGCFAPPCEQAAWLRRWHFMEAAGNRWWGLPGGVYMLRAIKRVHSMRLITSPWKSASMRAKTLRPAAQKESNDR
jgi:SAM-dependent methyltransferase